MCMSCISLFVVIVLAIVLSVLPFTDSDYSFGIFELLPAHMSKHISKLICQNPMSKQTCRNPHVQSTYIKIQCPCICICQKTPVQTQMMVDFVSIVYLSIYKKTVAVNSSQRTILHFICSSSYCHNTVWEKKEYVLVWDCARFVTIGTAMLNKSATA
jgi:hypothetical protein